MHEPLTCLVAKRGLLCMNLHNASYDGTKETSRYYVPHHTLFLPLATPMLSYSHYSFAQALTTTMYRVFEFEMLKIKVMNVINQIFVAIEHKNAFFRA